MRHFSPSSPPGSVSTQFPSSFIFYLSSLCLVDLGFDSFPRPYRCLCCPFTSYMPFPRAIAPDCTQDGGSSVLYPVDYTLLHFPPTFHLTVVPESDRGHAVLFQSTFLAPVCSFFQFLLGPSGGPAVYRSIPPPPRHPPTPLGYVSRAAALATTPHTVCLFR